MRTCVLTACAMVLVVLVNIQSTRGILSILAEMGTKSFNASPAHHHMMLVGWPSTWTQGVRIGPGEGFQG